MAHDVFVSYSTKDKPTADAVCATLESRGIRCWIAPRDVLPSEEYASALVNALRASRLLVLVFSSGANQSPQVLREVERAVSRGLPILPLRIEDVAPSAAMEYYISSRHWLDALTTPLEKHLVQLAETVTLLLARPVMPAADEPSSAQAVKPVPPVAPVVPVPPGPPLASAAAPTAAALPPVAPAAPRVNEPVVRQPAAAPPRTVDPARAARRRVTVAAAFMLMLLGMELGPGRLAQYFGFGRVELQLIAVVKLAAFAASSIMGGIWLRRQDPRRLATIAGAVYAAGLLLTGITVQIGPSTGYVVILMFSAACGGFGSGLGLVTALTTLLKWSPGRPGLMAGVVAASYAAGAVLFSRAADGVMSMFGPARAFLGIGILVLIGVAGVARLMTQASGDLPAGRSLGAAVGSRQWYVLWILLFLNTLIGALVFRNAMQFVLAYLSPVPPTQTQTLALFGAAVAGRLLWAGMSDKAGGHRILVMIGVFQTALLLLSPTSIMSVLLITAAILFCNGGVFGTIPALTADAFGLVDIGAIYGVMLTAWALATAVAPVIHDWWLNAGVESERQGLSVVAGVMVATAVMSWMIRNKRATAR